MGLLLTLSRAERTISPILASCGRFVSEPTVVVSLGVLCARAWASLWDQEKVWGLPGVPLMAGSRLDGGAALSGMCSALSAYSCSSMAGFFLSSKQPMTSLLCSLSDYFIQTKEFSENIKYFNNTVKKLDRMTVRILYSTATEHTFHSFQGPWNTDAN